MFIDGWLRPSKLPQSPVMSPSSKPVPSANNIADAIEVFGSACVNQHMLSESENKALIEAAGHLDRFYQGMQVFLVETENTMESGNGEE
jgi:hypothetical protein